jgi:hypothetical protein
MHDGKTVTFAQHFLEIGEPVTVQVHIALFRLRRRLPTRGSIARFLS